jgi:hypothetical protein
MTLEKVKNCEKHSKINDVFVSQVGNPTVTVIALCALQDFNLEQEITQVSLLDLGAVSILLNLLKTDHRPCMVGVSGRVVT